MRLAAALVLLLAAGAGPAAAHGSSPMPIQPGALRQAWSFDPLAVASLLVAHWAYGRGVLRLWARAGRGRGIGRLSVVSFALGETALVAALVSPLDQLGGTLLSAHMAQHGVLVAVAPPLLLLGQPGAAFTWALPAGWSRGGLAAAAWRPLARFGRFLSRPLPAVVLHGLSLWGWHAPGLFNAAIEHEWLHRLEHAAFFGTGLLFWRAVLDARSGRRIGPALGAAFATLVHGGFLGALITLAPFPLYAWYVGRAELWGTTALDDQQLAGFLMWVPMGVVYFGACLLLASRLLAPEDRRGGRVKRAGPNHVSSTAEIGTARP